MESNLGIHNFNLGIISGVKTWQMPTYPDLRGRLFKAYSSTDKELFPVEFDTYEHFFTQSNKNVFRGMHFQGDPHAVSKIISIVTGRAIDFLFDMRKGSDSFGLLQIIELDDSNPASIFIPVGVAHGYLSLEEKTVISYRMDGPFCANCDDGFSGKLTEAFLPILFSDTVKSLRDTELVDFRKYQYSSPCK